MSTSVVQNVFQSKYGYHPCDYGTYKKFKRLNFFANLSEHFYKKWVRWSNKQPQNRFVKTKIRHPNGHVIAGWKLDSNGKRIPWIEPIHVPITITTEAIKNNYKNARFPFKSASEVIRLTGSLQRSEEELKMLENWYKENIGEIEMTYNKQ